MEVPISELPAKVSELLDLGRILGENHAFGVVAGRCTAAQAAGLLRLRKGKRTCSARPTECLLRPPAQNVPVQSGRFIRLWQEFDLG
jgi:hypothetical protein